MGIKKHFKVGEWVKSYSKGIHRVERIVPLEYEEYHYFIGQIEATQLGAPDQSMVVLKRLLNSKFKRQFGTEHCSISYLKPLSKDEQRQLDQHLAETPELITALDAYELADFDTRYGLNFYLLDEELHILSALAALIRKEGKTFTEIFEWLDRNRYRKYLVPDPEDEDPVGNYVQFINFNFETKRKKLLFRDVYAFTSSYVKIAL